MGFSHINGQWLILFRYVIFQTAHYLNQSISRRISLSYQIKHIKHIKSKNICKIEIVQLDIKMIKQAITSLVRLLISLLFTTLIYSTSVFSQILLLLQCFHFKSLVIKQLSSRIKALKEHRISLFSLLKFVMDIAFSLIFVFTISGYNTHFVNFLHMLGQGVHKIFLGKIIAQNWESSLPYQQQLLRSLTFLSTYLDYLLISSLPYVFLIFGYLGLSIQIALTIDLIFLFTLPTILIYKCLSKSYSSIIYLIGYIYFHLKTDQKHCLTKKYPQIFNYESVKIISVVSLIFLAYFLVVIGFYYLWLALVIVGLKILINLLQNINNLVIFTEQTILKLKIAVSKNKQKFTLHQRNFQVWKNIKNSLKNKLFAVISFQTVFQVFNGEDIILIPKNTQFMVIEKQKTVSQQSVSAFRIFHTFFKESIQSQIPQIFNIRY